MHQYFTNTPLTVGERYEFTKEQAHHVKNVLRMDGDRIRLVHEGKGYFAHVVNEDGKPSALVDSIDERVNELGCELTLAIALIRKEKFELVLQKATELGVTRIVPFVSSRCVVQPKKEKSDKQLARWQAIVLEASEQCKRNRIPEITSIQTLKEMSEIETQVKVTGYENAFGQSYFLSQVIQPDTSSALVAIGPEGGFSEAEIAMLAEKGFLPVTFGNRILRAETAAMYACSVIAEITGDCA